MNAFALARVSPSRSLSVKGFYPRPFCCHSGSRRLTSGSSPCFQMPAGYLQFTHLISPSHASSCAKQAPESATCSLSRSWGAHNTITPSPSIPTAVNNVTCLLRFCLFCNLSSSFPGLEPSEGRCFKGASSIKFPRGICDSFYCFMDWRWRGCFLLFISFFFLYLSHPIPYTIPPSPPLSTKL